MGASLAERTRCDIYPFFIGTLGRIFAPEDIEKSPYRITTYRAFLAIMTLHIVSQ